MWVTEWVAFDEPICCDMQHWLEEDVFFFKCNLANGIAHYEYI